MAPGLNELEVVPFKVAAYNKKSNKMEYYDPTRKDKYEFISGKELHFADEDIISSNPRYKNEKFSS